MKQFNKLTTWFKALTWHDKRRMAVCFALGVMVGAILWGCAL